MRVELLSINCVRACVQFDSVVCGWILHIPTTIYFRLLAHNRGHLTGHAVATSCAVGTLTNAPCWSNVGGARAGVLHLLCCRQSARLCVVCVFVCVRKRHQQNQQNTHTHTPKTHIRDHMQCARMRIDK